MKTLKRILTVVAFCFALALLATPMQSEAAPKLSKKKLTIGIGEKATLTVKKNKKKVKWSSSAKKVASVNQKGVVTGKAAGKTVITAKVGKKSLKCNVTVKSLLSANKTVVRMKMGEKATVKITFPKINSYQVTWNVGDKDIVQPKWANKWTKKDINLYLTAGDEIGTTTVTITNKFNKEKVKITVIVEPDVKITVKNKLPNTFAEYNYSDEVETMYKITDVTYDLTYYSWKNSYTAHIFVDGEKLFDEDGNNNLGYVTIEWKLYKNGYVVDSGSRLSPKISTGEKFAKTELIIFDLTDGEYILEFTGEVNVNGYETVKKYIKKNGTPNASGYPSISTVLGTDTDYQYVEIAYNESSDQLEFFYYRDEETYDSVTSVLMTWDGKLSSPAYVAIDQEMVYIYTTNIKGTASFTVPNFTKDSNVKFQAQYTSIFEEDTVYNTLRASLNLGVASWNLLLLEPGVSLQEMGFASY